MILKDFIEEVCDAIQCYDDTFKVNLLRTHMTNIEDKVTAFTHTITKSFKVTVPDTLEVRLPYDFRIPKSVKINGTELLRDERSNVEDASGSFSIDMKRVILPSDEALFLRPSHFEYINIYRPTSIQFNGYGYLLNNADHSILLGEIFDNENVYYRDSIEDTEEDIKIRIQDVNDDNVKYTDIIRVIDGDILELVTVYGIYEIVLMDGVKEYYIAKNGFAYSDVALTTLVSRGRLTTNNLIINFNSITVGDEVEITYGASGQKYVNENQISIVAEMYKDAILKGAIHEGYKFLQKPQKIRSSKDDYDKALKIIKEEAGRFSNYGKQKKFVRKQFSAYRHPGQI